MICSILYFIICSTFKIIDNKCNMFMECFAILNITSKWRIRVFPYKLLNRRSNLLTLSCFHWANRFSILARIEIPINLLSRITIFSSLTVGTSSCWKTPCQTGWIVYACCQHQHLKLHWSMSWVCSNECYLSPPGQPTQEMVPMLESKLSMMSWTTEILPL